MRVSKQTILVGPSMASWHTQKRPLTPSTADMLALHSQTPASSAASVDTASHLSISLSRTGATTGVPSAMFLPRPSLSLHQAF